MRQISLGSSAVVLAMFPIRRVETTVNSSGLSSPKVWQSNTVEFEFLRSLRSPK